MQMPVIEVPLIGRAGAVALFALVHIMFANLALGGPLIAVASEWWGMRTGDTLHDRFAYAIAKANVVGFGVGATLGVAFVAVLAGLWPTGWAVMLNMYFWPLVLAMGVFFLEGIALYYYLFSWRRRPLHKKRHLAWGVLTAVTGIGLFLIFDGMAAAMLTPQPNALSLGGGDPSVVVTRFAALYLDNPTWLPSSLHRLVGALSFTGFLVAAVAGAAYLRARTEERKAYFRWMSGYGVRFGLLPLIAMPAIGFFYVQGIRLPSPTAYASLMTGDLRWVFDLQVALLGGLFLLGNWYVVSLLRGTGDADSGWQVVRHWTLVAGLIAISLGSLVAWYGSVGGFRSPPENWGIVGLLIVLYAGAVARLENVQTGAEEQQRKADWGSYGAVLLPLLLLCGVIAAAPYNQLGLNTFFLGQMRPWRFAALIGLTTLTIPIGVLYLKARARGLAERKRPAGVALPMASGVVALAIMFVMGYAREAARAPYLVFNQLAVADDAFERAGSATTVPLPSALALPLIVLGMLLFAVLGWLVLQVAHGPVEEEEEVSTPS
ncbi:MAG: cytochrome ubiquinol oxidase subunit I, partial [Chloroflexota bacterium]